MINMNILRDVVNNNKLLLVEPSEEMEEAYLNRCEQSLSSAKVLLNVGNLNDSVSWLIMLCITFCLLYYIMLV